MTTPIENIRPPPEPKVQQNPSYNEMLHKMQEEDVRLPMNTYQPPQSMGMHIPTMQQPNNSPEIPKPEINSNIFDRSELMNLCIIGVILHSPFVQQYIMQNFQSLYKNEQPTLISAIFFGVLTTIMYIIMKKVNIKFN